jgi:hypothetical protein
MIKKPLAMSELPALHEPLPLLTTTELGKILRIPPMRITRAIRRGLLRPDFTTLTINLFRPASVPQITKALGLN